MIVPRIVLCTCVRMEEFHGTYVHSTVCTGICMYGVMTLWYVYVHSNITGNRTIEETHNYLNSIFYTLIIVYY